MLQAKRAKSKIVSARTRLATICVALLQLGAACAWVGAAHAAPTVIPKIEGGTGWQLSEGCRIHRLGVPTEPDCDILIGEGITVQITRFRLLTLPPGQDDRPVIGIQLQPDHGHWVFSSPFVALQVAGRIYAPAEVDQATAFGRGARPVFSQRLEPHHQQYELPPGEMRFFRLRFSIPQRALESGFALRVTGLQRAGVAVKVPTLRFE